jgi:hypothetical protein
MPVTLSHDGSNTNQVVAHGVGDRGKGGARVTIGTVGGSVRDLASTQRHQGSRGVGVRHHMEIRGSGGVNGSIGEGSFAGAGGVGGSINVVAAAFAV